MATALIRPLAWEPPHAAGAAQEMAKRQKKKKKKERKKTEINQLEIQRTGGPVMVQRKQIRLGTMRWQVRSLALLSGLRIRRCCEVWCRLQTWL